MDKSPKYLFQKAFNSFLQTSLNDSLTQIRNSIKTKGQKYLENWESSNNFFSSLPIEIISNEVFSYFNAKQLLTLSKVNSAFYVMSNQDKFWQRLYKQDWGISFPVMVSWKASYQFRHLEKYYREKENSEFTESKGDFVMLDNEPFEILEVAYSKPGKSGLPKKFFLFQNIFNEERRRAVYPKSYQLTSVIGEVRDFVYEVFYPIFFS